ncbi:MAG TPA: glycoside hydrolase family 16 protein [Verrucomicrobiae bacterium]|nr:glycoside hydrolase family 16 protein [Verrucomicrobiae bacterium]
MAKKIYFRNITTKAKALGAQGVQRIQGLNTRNKVLLAAGLVMVFSTSTVAIARHGNRSRSKRPPVATTSNGTDNKQEVLSTKSEPPKPAPQPAPAPKPQAAAPKLVWQQDFSKYPNGPLDPKYWNVASAATPIYNDEAQKYDASSASVRIVGGKLILEARKTASGYTSGRVDTMNKQQVTIGSRLEANIKLPKGKGTWPAFWLLSANQPHTTKLHPTEADWEGERFYMWDGEIDIMEAYGTYPNTVEASVFTFGKDEEKSTPVAGASDGFHTYWLEWRTDGLTFGVDDKAYSTYKKASDDARLWPFNAQNKMYVILNLAMGGSGGGPIVQAAGDNWGMEVAWVKYFQL